MENEYGIPLAPLMQIGDQTCGGLRLLMIVDSLGRRCGVVDGDTYDPFDHNETVQYQLLATPESSRLLNLNEIARCRPRNLHEDGG